MIRAICIAGLVIELAGCGTPAVLPSTPAERESGYTYIPIDPFSVQTARGEDCAVVAGKLTPYRTLFESLPDNAVRMLIERFNTSGTVTYGPAKFGARGESYRVTIDYINADTINMPVWISKSLEKKVGRDRDFVAPFAAASDLYKADSEEYLVSREKPRPEELRNYAEFNIPVYIGIGLRITANVDVVGANANISGIGVIGAEADAEKVRGSLIVQTLGVNGKSIAAALPIQSELNRTTAQSAIVSVGSIKSLLYADETVVSPRVVGIYLPFPGGKPLVNAIISELSKKRVQWERPCKAPKA
jgi:hypothetical protein